MQIRRVSRGLISGLILALAALAASSVVVQAQRGNAAARTMKNPVAATAQSVTAGQQMFQKNCRFCHGRQGKGDGPSAEALTKKGSPPPDLTDHQWGRGSSDGEVFTVIRDGAGPKFEMKGFKGRMTETEMWNVVNYVKSLARR
jgi:mono/diheme cytochrome c family protein